MPRIARSNQYIADGVYHVMSRITLDRHFDDHEKTVLQNIMYQFTSIYFARVYAFCVMGNHFHLIVQMRPELKENKIEFNKRFEKYKKQFKFTFYGDQKKEHIKALKEKWCSLSELLKDIKQNFTRFYNKKHNRRGYLWGDRFKSVLIEKGLSLLNCMAYVDLNPVRAGVCEKPEDYKWSSIYYHVVKKNKYYWLSLDYHNPYNPINESAYIKRTDDLIYYRQFMYEIGSESPYHSLKIPDQIFKSAENNDFKYSFKENFLHQCRNFSDSFIVGSKDFVTNHYLKFKDQFKDKQIRSFPPIRHFDDMISMKRLRNVS